MLKPTRLVVAFCVVVVAAATLDASETREERWGLLFQEVRREHPLWEGAGRFPRRERAPLERLSLPTILPAETWGRLLGRPVTPERVAAAILDERAASFLYRGLFQLDPETLAFVMAREDLLRALHDGPVDVLAAFAGSLQIRDGRVASPGGVEAVSLWEETVGETVARPERFLPRLLSRDAGAVAALFDAVARLDPARQRFALGLNESDTRRRQDRLLALRRAMDAEPRWWRPSLGAYARPLVDPARVLAAIAVDEAGRAAPPSGRRFWEGIFGVSRRASGEEEVDAPWLVEVVGLAPAGARRERLTQLLFAQRVFGSVPESSGPDVATALRGLAAYPALVLTLDRMDVREPALYAAAVAVADRLSTLGGGARRVEAIESFQATLALLDRARSWARTLDAEPTTILLRSLFSIVPSERGYPGALARWWDAALVPALRRATRADDGAPKEAVVSHALSGRPFDGREEPAFEWEGLRFRSDPGDAELQRFVDARRRQGGATLDDALRPRRPPQPPMDGAALSRVLVSMAYATHLGPADGSALAGSSVALRHVFGDRPWGLPVEVSRPGVPWHLEGSLLALDLGLAGLAPTRVGTEMPASQPGLDGKALLPYARAIALMSPFVVRDEDVAALTAAIARGRERARRIAASAEVDAAARDAGLEAWRREGLRWAILHEPEARDDFFTLGELFDLGSPGGRLPPEWGTCDLALGGALRLRPPDPRPLADDAGRRPEDLIAARLPDLSLRVAEDLGTRSLPASLAPALLARVVRDFGDGASPLDYDDRIALARLARDASEARSEDLIASLAGDGPLRPAPRRETPTP